MEFINRADTCAWVQMARNCSKEGELLLNADSLTNDKKSRESLFGVGKRNDPIVRVYVKVVGNMMSVNEIIPSDPSTIMGMADEKLPLDNELESPDATFKLGPTEGVGLIVLERISLELDHARPSLSFPFNIIFPDGSHCQFSAITDKERTAWMEVLSAASNERSQAEVDVLLASPGASKKNLNEIVGPEYDMGLVSTVLANPVQQRHILRSREVSPTGSEDPRPIVCEEWMMESRLSLTMPSQCLKQYALKCRKFTNQLKDAIPYLSGSEQKKRLDHCRSLMQNLTRYQRAIDFLESWDGPFKQSIRRDREELAFVPTNLHWQRFLVKEEKDWEWADWMTSGCVSATAMGYETGGAKETQNIVNQILSNEDDRKDSDEYVYAKRRKTLKEIVNRVGNLKAMEKNNVNGTGKGNGGNFATDAMRDVDQILVLLDQWIEGFPHIYEAATGLQRHYEIYKESAEKFHQIPIDQSDEFRDETPPADIDTLVKDVHDLVGSFRNSQIEEKDTQISETCRQKLCQFIISMERLCCILSDAQIYRYLCALGVNQSSSIYYSLQYRKDVILTQAAVIVSTGILGKIWFLPVNEEGDHLIVERMESWIKGEDLLFGVVSHLSCYREEKGMMEDMAFGWAELGKRCVFRVVRAFSSLKASAIVPIVELTETGILISLPVPERIFVKLSQPLQAGANFRVRPIFWNVGINSEATLANSIGNRTLEKTINDEALSQLESYLALLEGIGNRSEKKKMELRQARGIFKLIKVETESERDKNVKILKLAAKVCKVLDGEVLMCCKSGKDRTGMGVTLEEAQVLRDTKGLPESLLPETLEVLRRDGVRRTNCMKNVGVAQYAFNGIQIRFLPPDYRPPSGTYRQMNLLPS